MRLRPLLALLVAASFGAAAACLLELDLRVDCGDNFIDERAGEDCEPAIPASYEGRCDPGQVATADACDPNTCTFDPKHCTSCGNGVVDPGEQCDPGDMSSATCIGDGEASCRDDCTLDLSGCAACGNGVIDVDEECDLALGLGDIAVEIPCTELGSPYGPGRIYGSGTATKCNSQCEWDRSHCLYCRNKRLESDEVASDIFVDFEKQITPVPEVCDEGADGEILSTVTS